METFYLHDFRGGGAGGVGGGGEGIPTEKN